MMPKAQIQYWSVPMPITQKARQSAIKFAQEQPNQQKALQVYLNTLAVCAVDNYLRMMDIPTDLTASDSWNPVVRLAADIADLWVIGLGRLECRPMQTTLKDKVVQKQKGTLWGQFLNFSRPIPACYIPPEVQDERIGYVVVHIDLEQQEAILLGFSQKAVADKLPIGELQPINELLKHLERISLSVIPVNLSQWWQNLFEIGWQPVEALLDAQIANYAFRRSIGKSVKRAKLLTLRKQPETTVALVVTLTQQETAFGIILQLFPQKGEISVGVKLTVLDESGGTFFEVSSKSTEQMIQTRQFGGQPGERFRVQVSLNDDNVTEDFTI